MADNSQLAVYSASAGSGKTYTLARHVIDILVANPRSYSHLLAVTFTNKAMGEMKERIVRDLDIIANRDASDAESQKLTDVHVDMAAKRGQTMSSEEVRSRCATALRYILMDYSQFSVQTIDSFVQRVIRAFAYEQGLPSNYGMQMEIDPVIDSAVDNLMESLSANDKLRHNVLRMTEEAIEDEKSWSKPEQNIKDLGKSLLKEGAPHNLDALTDENIDLLKKTMAAREKEAVKRVFEIVDKLKNIVVKHKVTSDLNQRPNVGKWLTGALPTEPYSEKNFNKCRKYAIEPLAKHFLIQDVNSLKKSKTKGDFDGFANDYTALVEQMKDAVFILNDARLIRDNADSLSVMSEFKSLVQKVALDSNKMNMSDTGKLLRDLIDGCNIPFVYEKIGVRYDNMMIDEFQDTSETQYENFRPLLDNSLSEGHDCLVVGDIKQSIYRFRGGDWQLLGRRVAEDFEGKAVKITLESNFRSQRQIVEFNNVLFRHLPKVMDDAIYTGGIEPYDPNNRLLEAMYQDSTQKPQKGDKGYVRVEVLKAKGEIVDKYIGNSYAAAVKTALEKGYSPSDICFLVRNNKTAPKILERLGRETWNGEPLAIMPDDALMVMNSPATQCIYDVMRYLDSGEREPLFSALRTLRGVSVEELGTLFATSKEDFGAELEELRNMGLLELANEVVNRLPEKLRAEDALYIDAFREKVMEAIGDGEADLRHFTNRVEEEGNSWKVFAQSSKPAIKIMTFHKSKGLEFKVVLIPDIDWDLEVKAFGKSDTLWCSAAPLGIKEWEDGIVPLNYGKALHQSSFAHEYQNQRELNFADNLNNAYVAFTRPCEVLMAWGLNSEPKDAPKKGEVESPGNMGKYISRALLKAKAEGDGRVSDRAYVMADDETFSPAEDGDGDAALTAITYEDGEMPTASAPKDEAAHDAQMDIAPNQIKRVSTRFKVNTEVESRIIGDSASEESADARAIMVSLGLTNHSILESVGTLDDLHGAIHHAVLQGRLDESEAEAREVEMREKISSNPTVAEWFDGEKVERVWPEVSMVGLPSGQRRGKRFGVRRPDRVMSMADGRTLIVDYKFGKRESSHKAQVKEYLDWIQKAGFENVEAYIWYYAEGEVEKVVL